MTHYILAKFKPDYADNKAALYPAILELFTHTKELPGVYDVQLHRNCIDRANRYDIMIMIRMERDSLPLYDACVWHKQWKEQYGAMLESKAIFDSEA